MRYDARYRGSHCDIDITVTAYDIREDQPPAPVLDSYKCPMCKAALPLALVELGSGLGEVDDDDELDDDGLDDDEDVVASCHAKNGEEVRLHWREKQSD